MPPPASGSRPAAPVISIGKFYHPRSGGVEIVTRTIAEEVVQVQLPKFFKRQVFTNPMPGAIRVPSGMVTSATN